VLAALLSLLVAQDAPAEPQATLTKLPQLMQYVEAPYPEAALAEKREGTVVLAIDVDEMGDVQRVEVLESAGEFDLPAMEAACGFLFSPAEAGELGPVPVRITYRYGFVFRSPDLLASTATTATTAVASAQDLVLGPVNFLGTIKEAGSRAPIAFATVEVQISTTATTTRTSTETDERGRFAFRGLPAGEHLVTVRAPLFARFDAKEEIRDRESIEVLYYVTRSERNPYEVVVRTKLERKEVARRVLKFEEIERLPGTQGDAIRVIQNLPGVARPPFGIGLLIVRGAPPQDTGVFLDGHRMPILFHFGGIGGVTSVLNSRMLDAIEFLPGGFGPEYGRISAGAVELRTRYAATDRVHGEAVLDISGANIFIEGPISEDEDDGAFVLALRRSYIDGVLAGVLSVADTSVALAPRYYDYQARYDRPLGDRRRMLSLLFYGSDDELVLLGLDTGSATPEGTESRTYFHRFNPKVTFISGENVLSISPLLGIDYSAFRSTGDPSGETFRLSIKDWNAAVRIDGTTRLSESFLLRAGGDVQYFEFKSESVLPALPRTKDFPSPVFTDAPVRKDEATVPAVLSSLYAELEITAIPRLTLWPGVRFDLYDFSAEPGPPLLDPRLIAGRTLVSVDPRLNARYALLEDFDLKGQIGIFRQPPLPPQFYLNADLPLQVADQASLGFDWQILDKLSLDLQGFYRFVFNQPRATRDVELIDGELRPIGFRPEGELRAFGIEALLKLEKQWGLFGWIAYTLSRGEYRREDEEWEPNFFADQTHNLIIVGSYDLGLNWTLSARFRYVTGGGLPRTLGRWYDADRDDYDRAMSDDVRRAPAFHQLDIRIDKRWVFDEWYFEAYLDVQNVYNRTNTELYAPTFDFKTEIAIPSLPIFPIIGVKGVF
jgi:TonB family protein